MTLPSEHKPPKFLVFRYAHGSAGKFLMSLFTLHAKVAHPIDSIQKNKTYSTHRPWFESSFRPDLDTWLKNEPNPNRAWNLYFVSNTYERGNHYSNHEFLEQCRAHASDFFWRCVDQDLMIPVAWHKQFVPEFYKNSHMVTIIIDPPSKKWFHRALWYKHYRYHDNELIFKTHDVSNYSTKLIEYYKQFDNVPSERGHFITLVKKYILRSKWIEEFNDQERFDDPTLNQVFVNLSDLLDSDKCCKVVDQICESMSIEKIDHEIIKQYQSHWKSCHDFKYS